MALHKIRTVFRPDVELEVDDAELADLRFLGAVVDSQATTPEGLHRAAVKATTEKNQEK